MHAVTAFTGDVVTAYCFPKSYGLLDQSEFTRKYYEQSDFAPEYYELWMSILS